MKTIIHVVLLVVLLNLCFVEVSRALRWRKCQGNVIQSIKVEIPGCEKERRCKFIRGQNVSINVHFRTSKNYPGSKTLSAVVYGKLSLFPDGIPFPLPDSNACGQQSQIRCPLVANSTYTYSVSMPIHQLYPPINVGVELQLKDDRDMQANGSRSLVCIAFPVRIV